VHDRAELGALLLGAGIDRDQRDVFRGDLGDRALEHVEVGNRDDHAVIVACRGLLDQTRHVGDIAVRWIAIVGFDVEVFVGLFDRVLDRVPPRVGIRCMADQHEMRVGAARPRQAPKATAQISATPQACAAPLGDREVSLSPPDDGGLLNDRPAHDAPCSYQE
jgi:hypothetical protein